MKKFEFNKSYEEVEIGGKVYKISFNDDDIRRYVKEMKKYYEKADKMREIDLEELTEEQVDKLIDESLDLAKKFIDVILGKGSFDELYEASGRSSDNMKTLVEFIQVIIAEKTVEKKREEKNKYVKK